MSSVQNVSNFTPNVIFQALHENAILAGKERGGSALGLESDGPLTGKVPRHNMKTFLTNQNSGASDSSMEQPSR